MISVCLASYNGEKYIEQQIESIVTQISSSDELIISDDGSTDSTTQIVYRLAQKYPQIKILKASHNSINPQEIKNIESTIYKEFNIIYKVALNFLRAIKEAKGDTIYLCDQDDIWLPDKISVCESRLKLYDVVVHRRQDVNTELEPIRAQNKNIPDNRKATFFQSLVVSHFQGACMGFTRRIKDNIIENLDLFSSIPLSQDHAIGYIALVFSGQSKICFEPKQLILYRRHNNNVSPTGEKSKHSILFKLLYRWNDIKFYLLLRKRKLFGR